MKRLLSVLAAGMFSTVAFAATHSAAPAAPATPAAPTAPAGGAADKSVKEPTAQQSKMASCNKEAADKKGDERKAFMKDCLSAKPKVSAAQKAQQDKMKTCNADAKGMKGDERSKFMKECLSKG